MEGAWENGILGFPAHIFAESYESSYFKTKSFNSDMSNPLCQVSMLNDVCHLVVAFVLVILC